MDNNGFIKRLWNWFDNSFLFWATMFFVAFIPLYPKIPLGEIIPGYIVRVRLEDFFILTAFLWWGVQVLRKKIQWKTPLTMWIFAYLLTGLFSNVLGVVLTKTIPAEFLHFGKSTLHWLRYIEYMSLFFIAYSAVKTRAHALWLSVATLATVLGVVIYGFGQKYYYWPVYSTMNREFSKGIRLYLGEFARAQSTFAGHYDLGAYLALLLPILLGMFFVLGGKSPLQFAGISPRVKYWLRWAFLFGWLSGLWLLVLSASRASFGGYVVAVGLVVLLQWRFRSFWWVLSRGFLVMLVSAVMMVSVGDLTTRFAQLIDQNKYPEIHDAYHTANDLLKHPQKLIGMQVGPKAPPPAGAKSVEELEAELNKQGMTTTDTQPTAQRPSDVYVDVPEKEYEIGDPAATLSGVAVVEKDGKLVQERVYSDCALKQSLSLCIRLETLWPRALQGFYNNPVVGSGYATLTKENVSQFTEAESTDNNFLRTLGENGALGFFFYYGIMGAAMWYQWQALRKTKDGFLFALAAGTFSGTIALLVNAMYIDVFVASKVASSFWLLQGIVLAVLVKEGVVAPQFAFERLGQKKDVAKLSELLKQVEEKSAEKTSASGYISAKKRMLKSTKTKKMVRRTRG